jgi:hypothetical protein
MIRNRAANEVIYQVIQIIKREIWILGKES